MEASEVDFLASVDAGGTFARKSATGSCQDKPGLPGWGGGTRGAKKSAGLLHGHTQINPLPGKLAERLVSAAEAYDNSMMRQYTKAVLLVLGGFGVPSFADETWTCKCRPPSMKPPRVAQGHNSRMGMKPRHPAHSLAPVLYRCSAQ